MVKSFKTFLDEEIVLAATVKRFLVDIDNPAVRDHINQTLANELSASLTPYNALTKARKVLANYHINVGATPFMEGSSGERSWVLKQFGEISGMNDQGEVVTKDPSPYTIVFTWNTVSGWCIAKCRIVSPEELSEGILSGLKHATGAKTKWGGAIASAATIAATAGAGAAVWPAHPIVGAGIAGAYALRKIIQRARAKKPDLVEARLTPAERRTILDARRMEASMQGRKVKMPRPKPMSKKDAEKVLQDAKKTHFNMASNIRRLPKEAKKETTINHRPVMTVAPRPIDLGKHEYKLVKPTPTKRYMPEPDVKSEFDKHIDSYNKTGKKAYLAAAERAAQAHYASNYPEYPEEAQKKLNDRMHVLGTIRQSNPSFLGKIKKLFREEITPNTSKETIIHDFVHSKNKTFKGDSKKKKIKRALGAYYSMHKE